MNNTCICCGKDIPEGQMVCYSCSRVVKATSPLTEKNKNTLAKSKFRIFKQNIINTFRRK